MKLRVVVYGLCLAALVMIALMARRPHLASEGYLRAINTGTVGQAGGENGELAAYRAYFAAERHDDHVLSRKIDRVLRLCEKGR